MTEETVSLKEHFEALLAERDKATALALKASQETQLQRDKALDAAFAASSKAIEIAESNSQKWRDNANEWRQAMNDKDRLLATKVDTDVLSERTTTVENWIATQKGKASQTSVIIFGVIAVVGFVLKILEYFGIG